MNKPYKISLSIGEFFSVENESESTIDKVNENQLIYGRTKCFSDGLNRNNYFFPLEVIKNAAHTIKGKPMLVAFNLFNSDGLGGHDIGEVGVGYVKDNTDITFEEAEDGRTFLCTDFVLWKYYSKNLPSILKDSKDNKKEVSVELLILDSEEDKENGYTIVNEFVFCGITILSQDITPAVKDAQMQITKFSNKAKSVFEELNNCLKKESEKSGSFLLLKNSKEEEMTKENIVKNSEQSEQPNQETLDNALKVERTHVGVSTSETTYNDDGSEVSTDEFHSVSTTVVKEVPDVPVDNTEAEATDMAKEDDETEEPKQEVVENDCDKDKEKVEMSEKYETLEKEYYALKEKCETLEKECFELRTFKENKEKEDMQKAIEFALNDVSDTLSMDEISEWREKSVTFANVDDFNNSLKAYAYDIQKKNGTKAKETIRNSLPKEGFEKNDSLWGSMENY